ncbi:HAD family hydrolase [Fimbriiglobus ruber]|uniref:Uncharacterized protein n=1 Tax=Fimbriiglobus ruber TaxID=1908690 RepID=A0A225EB24_9BACT|nr:HAD hydrolase-like protein [Fimbriiglobus ruber]OWK47236.1 hypothetical protein FRUB_00935 [Fimbriiglobus ruber]
MKKLLQKEYSFDTGVYGALNEFVQKVAYFFHASIQGTGAYPEAAAAIRAVGEAGIMQGLLADGQTFTPAQLARGLKIQDPNFDLAAYIPPDLRILSAPRKAKKPSETIFRAAVDALAARKIDASEILHVGSNMTRDIAPAKKFGMRTALFAGDKGSLVATPEQLKDPQYRPDVLLTELSQIAEVVG